MSTEQGAGPEPANRDSAVAREYHASTNHTLDSVRRSSHRLDWSNQPRPYKLYLDAPSLPLPEKPEQSGVPALTALSTAVAADDRPAIPDMETLAVVLYYSAGITKRIHYAGGLMEFRAAACTGALYHIELYVVCGDLPGLEAGVYQFATHDNSLRRLRSGDYRAALVEAGAGDQAIADAPVVIIYTSTFWRNAWKYQSRAYRHAFWDSGTILANTLALAAAWELPAKVITGFVDRDVNLLLDVDPEHEAALCLLSLGHAPERRPAASAPVEPLGLRTAPLSGHEVDYPPIRRMHAASSLQAREDVADWRKARLGVVQAAPPGSLTPVTSIDAGRQAAVTIEAAIRRRGSSRRFSEAPISFDALATILDCGMSGIPADYLDTAEASVAEPYLIVTRVQGLASGAYRFHHQERVIELLKSGDFTEQAGYLDLGQALGADAAVNVYFLADLDAALNAQGNRGYRTAQLDAAIRAGKMYLAAYALGLGATGLTFFDDDVIEFFSPSARGKSVMFLLALGAPARRSTRPTP